MRASGTFDAVTPVVLDRSKVAGSPPALDGDAIHVWTIALDDTQTGSLDTLSADEVARANRFRIETDRRRFVTSHTALRSILAAYLHEPPASLVFERGPWGKPELDPRHSTTLRFNLSHSHDLALVAVTRQHEVGVDVERLRPVRDLPGLVARVLSASERVAFDRLSADLQLPAFFRCWTLKEACVKAAGEGIHRPFDRIDVGVTTSESCAAIRVVDEQESSRTWELFPLAPGGGYVAAVGVRTE